MQSLIDSYKKTKNLHHAYALEGDREEAMISLFNFFENNLKIQTKANPDFYFNEFKSFGIDNGKEIQNLASRKAVLGSMRIFVITFSFITSQAQNSLLKLFEEPAEGVHFFIIISSSEIFLPTLRSRLHILKLTGTGSEEGALANKFIKVSYAERLNLLKDIIENKYLPAGKAGKEEALKLLNDLEAILYNKYKGSPCKNEDVKMFEMIQKSRDYIRGRAPSVKMILENIALSV